MAIRSTELMVFVWHVFSIALVLRQCRRTTALEACVADACRCLLVAVYTDDGGVFLCSVSAFIFVNHHDESPLHVTHVPRKAGKEVMGFSRSRDNRIRSPTLTLLRCTYS